MPKVSKIPGEPAEQLSDLPNAEIEAKQVAHAGGSRNVPEAAAPKTAFPGSCLGTSNRAVIPPNYQSRDETTLLLLVRIFRRTFLLEFVQ